MDMFCFLCKKFIRGIYLGCIFIVVGVEFIDYVIWIIVIDFGYCY